MSTTTVKTPASRGQLIAQAADAAIDSACRKLGLPTVRAQAGPAIAQATRTHASYAAFLAELLIAECEDRDQRATTRRLKAAGFPRDKHLADFDHTANTQINPATIGQLATCEWIRRGEPVCLIGDSGTGKSHLLIALGILAAEKGHKVKYTLATKMVNELAEAASDKTLARAIAKYGRVDLLLIDELGYMQLDRHGAELLFQVLTEREEKNSVAIASNQPFSGWANTFTDPRLCAAIVDRLTYNGTIIETGTTSYRLAHTRTRSRST
jgi:DNA replication protein DnaC